MESVQIKDKCFESYISERRILNRVKDIAAQINTEYEGKNPLFVGVLNGSFMFMSDLIKRISIPCEATFIRMSSYQGMESSGVVKQVLGLQENVFGRDLIIVEDIVDSGKTMQRILEFFSERGPKSMEIATLLLKPECLEQQLDLKFVGFEIPEKFVVGYGLDYDGQGRNLKDIYQLKGE